MNHEPKWKNKYKVGGHERPFTISMSPYVLMRLTSTQSEWVSENEIDWERRKGRKSCTKVSIIHQSAKWLVGLWQLLFFKIQLHLSEGQEREWILPNLFPGWCDQRVPRECLWIWWLSQTDGVGKESCKRSACFFFFAFWEFSTLIFRVAALACNPTHGE